MDNGTKMRMAGGLNMRMVPIPAIHGKKLTIIGIFSMVLATWSLVGFYQIILGITVKHPLRQQLLKAA